MKRIIPKNNMNFSINKQIKTTNIVNLMLMATTIGLFIILLIPENNELFLFPKIDVIEIFFHIEVFLAVIHVFLIYLFSHINEL